MQSLGAIAHYDFNSAGAHSYEQALMVIRRLGLGAEEQEQMFRRAVFNVLARNQDDHVKNIAFLMDREGKWRLSPAFDLTFAYRADGRWTSRHQMSLNVKRDGFTREDFLALADSASINRRRAANAIGEVSEALTRWPEFASEAGVPEELSAEIASHHRH